MNESRKNKYRATVPHDMYKRMHKNKITKVHKNEHLK